MRPRGLVCYLVPPMDLDTIVSLCKRRGFIFQSSEIYGGLGSAWDYGPLGVELKRNVKNLWWRENIQNREDMVGLDAAITMHPTVWKASGHADNCKRRAVERNTRAEHVRVAAETALPERIVQHGPGMRVLFLVIVGSEQAA